MNVGCRMKVDECDDDEDDGRMTACCGQWSRDHPDPGDWVQSRA